MLWRFVTQTSLKRLCRQQASRQRNVSTRLSGVSLTVLQAAATKTSAETRTLYDCGETVLGRLPKTHKGQEQRLFNAGKVAKRAKCRMKRRVCKGRNHHAQHKGTC